MEVDNSPKNCHVNSCDLEIISNRPSSITFQEFTCTDADVNKVTLKSIGNSQEVLQELEKLSGNVSGDRKRRNIVFTPGATSCEQGSASSGEYCGEFSEKF